MKEITSLNHPYVKHLIHLKMNRDYREEHQTVLVEGKKMVGEICSKHHAKAIFYSDIALLPQDVQADETIKVSDAIIRKISGVQTPEGIIAEVFMPPQANLNSKSWIIVCDGVSDPGNLGTILRTGLALGWDGAFVLENSCDPFNDKALRAAKGATFRFPINRCSWEFLSAFIKTSNALPFAADVHGTTIDKIAIKDGAVLILSNEAHGMSEEAKEVAKTIKIPMPGDMESLNVGVAGGILMYALKRSNEQK